MPKGSLWSPPEKFCFSLLHRLPSPAPTSLLLQILAFLLRRSLTTNLPLLTLLISSSPLTLARRIFAHRPAQDSQLCNTIIQSLVRDGFFLESLSLYRHLLRGPFSPDAFTFPSLFKASSSLASYVGPQLHTHAIKLGYSISLYVSTSLIDMYVKMKDLGCARTVFDEMCVKSVVSWTSMITGYVRGGDVGAAMELFRRMPEKDGAVFNAMIDGFVRLGNVGAAQRVFDEMGEGERDVVSWTSLVHGYCKVGDMGAARVLFDEMQEKNLFSWNVMIGGYCQNRQPEQALELFRELQSERSPFVPDEVTLVNVIPAIGDIGAMDSCRWIHNYVRRKGLDHGTNVSTSLVSMYAKCGDISEARRVFNGIAEKGVASWNAMINGLAVNGRAEEAMDMFVEMLQRGWQPNGVTMIGVLSACGHGGFVEEGRRWFGEMEAYGICPTVEHYGCMVDVLGRGGFLEEAERLLDEVPGGANGIMLSSLLFACLSHGDVERAERVMERVAEIEPGNVRNYVMLRNLYAGQKRWGDMGRVQELISQYGGKQEAGCSFIEVESRVWEFVARDTVHPQSEEIYRAIVHLKLHMEVRGPGELEADLHGHCFN